MKESGAARNQFETVPDPRRRIQKSSGIFRTRHAEDEEVQTVIQGLESVCDISEDLQSHSLTIDKTNIATELSRHEYLGF